MVASHKTREGLQQCINTPSPREQVPRTKLKMFSTSAIISTPDEEEEQRSINRPAQVDTVDDMHMFKDAETKKYDNVEETDQLQNLTSRLEKVNVDSKNQNGASSSPSSFFTPRDTVRSSDKSYMTKMTNIDNERDDAASCRTPTSRELLSQAVQIVSRLRVEINVAKQEKGRNCDGITCSGDKYTKIDNREYELTSHDDLLSREEKMVVEQQAMRCLHDDEAALRRSKKGVSSTPRAGNGNSVDGVFSVFGCIFNSICLR